MPARILRDCERRAKPPAADQPGFKIMQRVLVMGSSGSGKSTFARRLSNLTGLPFVSLDALYWQPGWQPSEPEAFGLKAREATNGPGWVMDGNYMGSGAGELRRELADTVIWFDLPRYVCMTGIMKRIIGSYGRVRPEMAPGCPERIDLEFIHYVWTFRQQQRPKLLEFFEALRTDQDLICFNRRKQADDYLAGLTPQPLATMH
jgi:adenylate kinase family enzyme